MSAQPATSPDRSAPPRGISPVLLTPFTDDGGIDESGFVRVADHVLSLGVGSVMFPGFASEMLALSEHERDTLTHLLVDRAARYPGATVIASVPDHATWHATRRTASLVEAGVGALNLLPPHQLGPPGDAVMAHIEAVLAAASPVPVILQYAPVQTGTVLDVGTVSALAARHPNLVAVKVESQPPGRTVAALLGASPPLPSLVGYGGVQMLDALTRGAVGVQPGCSFTELYLAVWAHREAGDHAAARELHTRMLPYLSYWMQDVGLIVAAEKLIAHRRGLIRSEHCRAPARQLDDVERDMVELFCTEFADTLPEVP
ncbi:dihydrodipicolinate synthase family protein [Actinobacteria bacterium YIM 96077]|uniref:Dihydrodipicolinate synthase family protein n=1 Tax=Phytoactinopolyspora halophila TaxID=1981511 RepID=A0A329QZ92_9ACTN|nr:dihydrodipicolinate synthase family protein [Phytoactinopolyspora halophila]AYY13159.1 dihydrodipicolinate synthase family protein [Actinobacteria bacterium YIM 96077]RAW17601.1 dihydrodipicolinate synthase family protein [Phytoactinopolyspora halophila]